MRFKNFWNEATALIGGTFDPPHLGHLKAVLGLFQAPGVRRVVLLPSPSPPSKACVAPVQNRLEMVNEFLRSNQFQPYRNQIDVDLREIRRRSQGYTYTFDTLNEIGTEYQPYAFVIGSDQLKNLPQWHRFPEVLGFCHWIVLLRKPDGHAISRIQLQEWETSGLIRKEDENRWVIRRSSLSSPLGGLRIQLAETDAPPLSSTSIRETLARTGRAPANSLTPEVLAYLKRHSLYGTEEDAGAKEP